MNPASPLTVNIDGISVSRLKFKPALRLMTRWLRSETPRRVATANLDFLEQAHHDRALRQALATADLVTADGTPLLWLAYLAGQPIGSRVPGSELANPLIAAAAQTGSSVYFLGGPPGVAQRAAKLLQGRHPSLRVAGIYDGKVDLSNRTACQILAASIKRSGARLLLVGLGCPKQELFLQTYLKATGASLGIGVGCTFGFLSGDTPRAPRFLQAAGLEWLHRLVREPQRLLPRYLRDFRYLLKSGYDTLWHRLSPTWA